MLVLLHFATFPLKAKPYKGSAGVNHRDSSSSRWCWRGSQSRRAERCHLHVQTALRELFKLKGPDVPSPCRVPLPPARAERLLLVSPPCDSAFSEWKQEETNEQRSGIIRRELSRCNWDDREEKLVEVTLDAAVRNNYISNRCYRVFGL